MTWCPADLAAGKYGEHWSGPLPAQGVPLSIKDLFTERTKEPSGEARPRTEQNRATPSPSIPDALCLGLLLTCEGWEAWRTSKNCGLFSSLSSGLPVGWLVLGDAFRRILFSLEGNFGPKERLRQSRGEESSCWWLGVGQAGDSLKVTQADKAPSVERLVRASPKARQDARYGRGHKIVWPCGRVAPFTTRTLHSSATPAAVCTLDPERAYTATGGKGSSQQHWLR